MKHTKPPHTATGTAHKCVTASSRRSSRAARKSNAAHCPPTVNSAFKGWPLLPLAALLVVFSLLSACSGGGNSSNTDSSASAATSPAAATSPGQPAILRLLTHDSFAVSDGTLAAFTDQTGIEVEVVRGQDTGTVVSQIILTQGNPVADVVFGVDNTFLGTALAADVFEPYVSAVPVREELLAGANGQVTPIDYGDVCLNYWRADFDDAAPASLKDLTDERYRGKLVVQNPETSSPGLAFLLATIAYFGEGGWEDYWRQLRANDVLVTSGWSEAYYDHFSAGGGERPLVVSYASSPVAEVVYADPPVAEPPTGIIEDSCFRQVEYAGILAGTDHVAASRQLIDFMLSDTFQQDIPLNMFVFPAAAEAQLPAVFAEHAAVPAEPLSLEPEVIAANKNDWTERWVELVLR